MGMIVNLIHVKMVRAAQTSLNDMFVIVLPASEGLIVVVSSG